MAQLRVEPRETPGERADTQVEIEIDDALATHAATLEEWTDAAESWQMVLRQGHDFGRADNVEARLLFVGGDHTCSITLRLDQIETVQELDQELWLTVDSRDGISTAVHLAPHGLDVELHHVDGTTQL